MTPAPGERLCTDARPCAACASGDEDHCATAQALEARGRELERLAQERANTIPPPPRPNPPTDRQRRSALAAFMASPPHPRTT